MQKAYTPSPEAKQIRNLSVATSLTKMRLLFRNTVIIQLVVNFGKEIKSQNLRTGSH